MTIQNFLDWLNENQLITFGYCIGMTALAFLMVSIVSNTNFEKTKYVIAVLVYAVTIPGICSALLILYALFMMKTSLLEVGVVTYFLPVICMTVSLVVIKKRIPMDRIPGFKTLSSFMILVGVSFVVVLVIQKMFFGVLFIGRFTTFLIIFIVLLVFLKNIWNRFTE